MRNDNKFDEHLPKNDVFRLVFRPSEFVGQERVYKNAMKKENNCCEKSSFFKVLVNFYAQSKTKSAMTDIVHIDLLVIKC